jgi:signal transduction histidine kinase
MAIYAHKQRWKIILLFIAAAIAGVTLWYTNSIAKAIRKEEKSKVELWHSAIRKKEELVNLTTVLFDSLRNEEANKAEILGRAMRNISNPNGDLTFEADVLALNTSIPILVCDESHHLLLSKNINQDLIATPEKVDILRKQYAAEHDSIPFPDADLVVYYSNSRMYLELKRTIDDLVNSFFNETVINTASVPVIVTDESQTEIVRVGKIDTLKVNPREALATMKEGYEPIVIRIPGRPTQYIFYGDSDTIAQLQMFPYLQLSFIGVFLLIAYLLFSTFRRSEQNLVWVGMAKETAHQLGTPLSALMGWRDLFQEEGISKELMNEFNKDIERLSTIADRFSKIGSEAALTPIDAGELIHEVMDYLRKRISSQVEIEIVSETHQQVAVNKALFSWVIENLVKNSVDAMDAKGKLTLRVHSVKSGVGIDVTDTGKGIPKRKWKTIFEPGYTTKMRGWGLGLSLTKRIVNDYHDGKIFVLHSELNVGTTFRILLKESGN